MTTTLVTFEAGAPAGDIAAALKRDGGVIIEKLLPAELMDEVYAEIEANVRSAELESRSVLWPEGNKTVGALAAVSPTFADRLMTHPKLLDVADAVLLPIAPMGPTARNAAEPKNRPKPIYEGTTSIAKNANGRDQVIRTQTDPERGPNCHHYTVGATALMEKRGPEGKRQTLHRENGIYQPFIEALPNMREFIVSSMWAGTDFTVQNGATHLVPGSHQWPEQRVAEEHEVAQAIMPKGSVVLWLSRTLHGAGASTTTEGRVGLFNSYIVDWVRQEENQYLAVSAQAAQRLSLPARQLLGFRSSEALGWVKGRAADDLLTEGVSGNL